MPSPDPAKSPIGVIGLGLLGSALADRLLDGGFPIVVYNRSKEKAAPLLDRGATWSDNPLAVCDRAVICLYTTDVVNQVLQQFDADLRPGQILIDATTGNPDQTQQLGETLSKRGVEYLESPIAASSEQTRQGQAVAMVAGTQAAFDACQDLYSALVAKVHYLGQWGNAAKIKLVNNLILGLNRAALAEGLMFAEAVGLAPKLALKVLRESNSYSGVMDTKGEKMVTGDFSTQAKLSQHAKDVRILIEQATQRGGRLPLSELHLKLLEHAEQAGWGELDNSAIILSIADVSKSDDAIL